MPRVLCYQGRPVALIEVLPNNGLGLNRSEVEGELCSRISPYSVEADVIVVTDEEADQLRAGVELAKVADTIEDDDDDEEDFELEPDDEDGEDEFDSDDDAA